MSSRATVELRRVAASLAPVAASLARPDPDEGLTVDAERRLRGLRIVEGLSVTNPWTDYFEPVSRRWLFSRRWRQLQSAEEAATQVERFLERRPDLG